MTSATQALERVQGVIHDVLWLDANLHNYGTDKWRGYFKALVRDAREADFDVVEVAAWAADAAEALERLLATPMAGGLEHRDSTMEARGNAAQVLSRLVVAEKAGS
jgi:hypothetical protein